MERCGVKEDRNQDCLCIVKIAGLVVTISTPGQAAVYGDGSSSMVVTARLIERSDTAEHCSSSTPLIRVVKGATATQLLCISIALQAAKAGTPCNASLLARGSRSEQLLSSTE